MFIFSESYCHSVCACTGLWPRPAATLRASFALVTALLPPVQLGGSPLDIAVYFPESVSCQAWVLMKLDLSPLSGEAQSKQMGY